MKVTQGNVRIEQIPAIDSIEVERDGTSEGGVRVKLNISPRKSLDFGVREFAEFADACNRAVREAKPMLAEDFQWGPADDEGDFDPTRAE